MKKNISVNILFVLFALGLTSCKPEDPPIPVPLTSLSSNIPCQDFTFAGFPREESVSENTFFMCKEGYVLNFNPTNKTSLWVAENLKSENLNLPKNHADIKDYRPEQLIPERLHSKNSDYIGTGYEMGQFAPFDNFLYDDVKYSHSFYLTNVFPIHFDKIALWQDINEEVRKIARKRGELYVISGPVYYNGVGNGWVGKSNTSNRKSRRGMIHVPSHIYKVIIDPKTNESIALIMENNEGNSPVTAISVLQLEKITGIRFLPDLPTEKSRSITSQNDWNSWLN